MATIKKEKLMNLEVVHLYSQIVKPKWYLVAWFIYKKVLIVIVFYDFVSKATHKFQISAWTVEENCDFSITLNRRLFFCCCKNYQNFISILFFAEVLMNVKKLSLKFSHTMVCSWTKLLGQKKVGRLFCPIMFGGQYFHLTLPSSQHLTSIVKVDGIRFFKDFTPLFVGLFGIKKLSRS